MNFTHKLIVLSFYLFVCQVNASTVTIPNNFQANSPAFAADVNENFTAIKTSVDDNDASIGALIATVNQLQNQVNALSDALDTANNTIATLSTNVINLNDNMNTVIITSSDNSSAITLHGIRLNMIESNTVLALNNKLKLSSVNGYDTAEFTGINVQVNDGSGDTEGVVNGLGNLIIGYNESSNASPQFCSNPSYDNQFDCINNSGNWARNIHQGSHNLIIGKGNSYNDYGTIVSGVFNISNGSYANVLGGSYNTASGYYSSISGGTFNTASYDYSSVSGGSNNTASGESSSVSGGGNNTASGFKSSVSGGVSNTASYDYSSVSGGDNNTASGLESSISGGVLGVASGNYSSISGGNNNTASGHYSSISAGVGGVASGNYSSICGGILNITSGESASVTGGNSNNAGGYASSISGGSSKSIASGTNSDPSAYDWRAGTLFEDL